MVMAMYLELKSPARRRGSHTQATNFSPPFSVSSPPRTNSASNRPGPTQPHPKDLTPEPASLSYAIERYIDWMMCQGIEVPPPEEIVEGMDDKDDKNDFREDLGNIRSHYASVQAATRFRKVPTKKTKKSILLPKIRRKLNKKVRWRDHEVNKNSVQCCDAFFKRSNSALEDVYDGTLTRRQIPFHRVPTPRRPLEQNQNSFQPSQKNNDDPILSFRERKINSRPIPLQRTPSPHPRAKEISAATKELQRSPSPYPRVHEEPRKEQEVTSDSYRSSSRSGTPKRSDKMQHSGKQPRHRRTPTPQRGRDEDKILSSQFTGTHSATRPRASTPERQPLELRRSSSGQRYGEIVWKSRGEESLPSMDSKQSSTGSNKKKGSWKIVRRQPSNSRSSQEESSRVQQPRPEGTPERRPYSQREYRSSLPEPQPDYYNPKQWQRSLENNSRTRQQQELSSHFSFEEANVESRPQRRHKDLTREFAMMRSTSSNSVNYDRYNFA